MMLRSSVRNFGKLCRYHPSFAALSILSLLITTLSFLVLMEKSYYTYQVSVTQEYLYVMDDSPEEICALYHDLQENQNLPDIVSISLMDDQYTGIACDTKALANLLPYGRIFTPEEGAQGANVALLSLEYVRNLPQEQIDQIWEDGIEIAGEHFEAVGGLTDIARYFPPEDLLSFFPVPTLIAIPAETYLSLSMQPTMLNCRFTSVLTKEQTEELRRMISSCEHISTFYLPGTRNSSFQRFVESNVIYIAILLMALIAVAFIVTCWFQTDQKRYQIYMICGAKKRHIVFFLTVDMLLLSQIAYWGALAYTHFINRGFRDFLMPLPLVWRVWIGIGVFAFCWLVVLLRSLPLLQHYRNVSGFEVK